MFKIRVLISPSKIPSNESTLHAEFKFANAFENKILEVQLLLNSPGKPWLYDVVLPLVITDFYLYQKWWIRSCGLNSGETPNSFNGGLQG